MSVSSSSQRSTATETSRIQMDDDITENATRTSIYMLGVETDKMKKMKQAYPMKIISIGDHYVGTFWAEKFAVSIQM